MLLPLHGKQAQLKQKFKKYKWLDCGIIRMRLGITFAEDLFVQRVNNCVHFFRLWITIQIPFIEIGGCYTHEGTKEKTV